MPRKTYRITRRVDLSELWCKDCKCKHGPFGCDDLACEVCYQVYARDYKYEREVEG
jgi:hypothetical protein